MAIFNQQGQKVKYQLNADTIHFGGVKTSGDLINVLQEFKDVLDQANKEKVLESKDAKEASEVIDKVIVETKSNNPDKNKISGYLSLLTILVGKVDGLVSASKKLYETVEKLL
ncbi:MAG: hypothetical protein O2970_12130 [Proteobacteria bacterium]|nr:hypothetical protein [Pseudomonadota bacterium]MDG4544525.1 hypothetical protein [Rickettsiales bacterium]